MNRILLIDDDIDDAGLFREALKRIAPSILFQYFNAGEEALRNLLEEKSVLPDIIFVDINMPKISGWEFLTSFRAVRHLLHIPVIIYSTSSEEREIKKAKELGANGFITKPDSFSQLKEMLVSILAKPVAIFSPNAAARALFRAFGRTDGFQGRVGLVQLRLRLVVEPTPPVRGVVEPSRRLIDGVSNPGLRPPRRRGHFGGSRQDFGDRGDGGAATRRGFDRREYLSAQRLAGLVDLQQVDHAGLDATRSSADSRSTYPVKPRHRCRPGEATSTASWGARRNRRRSARSSHRLRGCERPARRRRGTPWDRALPW